MSKLTAFHRCEGADDRGRTLSRMWAYSDEELETIHDFIQWMFPLRERSRFNPDAPVLTEGDVLEFHSDARPREHLGRSLGVFLAFLGLRLEGGIVGEAADFREKSTVWRVPNHNWLRITRVLTSTRILGLDRESRAFFDFLKSLRDGGRTGITPDTFAYWEEAVGGADRGPGEG